MNTPTEPRSVSERADDTRDWQRWRDYFEAEFVEASAPENEHNMNRQQAALIAKLAYVQADAMLRARSNPEAGEA